MSWYRRFVNVFRADRLQRDIDRELAFHVNELVDELVAAGMSEADARREARRRFGNREVLRDRVHGVDVFAWLDSLLADVRYALRALLANRGFTFVAVLSLGLGIGANTAIFSLINAAMLRSLPVDRPDELVQLTMGSRGSNFTNPLWEEIDRRQTVLTGVLAFTDQRFDLNEGGVVRRASGALVSGSFFRVLGVSAVRGRVVEPADDVRGCRAVAVLSYGFWQRGYGGAPDAIGQTISLSGNPFEIIGVAEPGFSGIHVGRDAGVFAPLCTLELSSRSIDLLSARAFWFLNVFGRLRPGGTLDAARAGLATMARGVFEATIPTHWSPDEQAEYTEMTLSAESATNGMSIARGQYRDALITLLVVVGVVLLIACANVAQLLLARATARHHEIAVRLAIGSGRARLVRQWLTESILLALLGAAVGILFARWSSGALVGFLSQGGRAVSLDLSLDVRVLAFAVAVATVVGMVFGMAPAWRSARVHPLAAMRSAARGVIGDPRHRVAKGIVVGQVALSLVLVMAAGLLVGSFRRLATIDPGFRADGVLVVTANWSSVEPDPRQGENFVPRMLVNRIRSIPGVRQASASVITPIGGTTWTEDVVIDEATSEDVMVLFNSVTDGYLETHETRLLAGRDFTTDDGVDAPRVVMVNESMARRFFGEESPVGKHVRTNAHDSVGPPMQIVGLVEDAKYYRLDEEQSATVYVPLAQTDLWGPSIALSLRTDGAPASMIPVVTEAIRDVDPAITVEFLTLSEQVANSLARPRLLATLSGFFGALALMLAVIGLYGTMSYSVARRRNEIGIRVALGAARNRVLWMVAGEAGTVIAIGVVLGTLIALAATRLVAAFVYGVTVSDPATLVLSALTLSTVGMAAGLVPAWRAAAVDPMEALREE